MNANLFLENGAIITMSGDQTRFFKEAYFITDGQKASQMSHPENKYWFINPEFSLKNLNKTFDFKSQTSEISEVLLMDIDQNIKTKKLENSNLSHPIKFIENLNWTTDQIVYQKKYKKILDLVKSGELKKAVPFITYKSEKPKNFNQLILPQILNRLFKLKHKEEYLYGLWDKDKGFVGSTPEVLLQRKPNSTKFNTMALAGTLPLADPTNMILDSKLSEEHKIVMQDITKKLSGHEVHWDQPKEKRYGILKHIHAEAEFLSNSNLNSLIEKLSPTSALGVYPSELWRDYGDILEIDHRGSYGAPFGFVSESEIMILVCLRGLFWDQDHLYIHVGGGVTSQSVYENEIKELELKFLSTKSKLGL